MRPKVYRDVPQGEILSRLPLKLRPKISTLKLTAPVYSLIVFPLSARVVRSPSVATALAGFSADYACLAAASCFTLEAREMLANKGALVVSDSDFGWQDDTWPPRPARIKLWRTAVQDRTSRNGHYVTRSDRKPR